jgi:broad specificity phosphatase PhoE
MKLLRTPGLLVAALVGLVGAGCAHPTTVLLVRHAEKGPGQDPDLTLQGQARAEALVEVAEREGVEAIFVTTFKRTEQTAAPAAKALGITPIVVPLGTTAQEHAAAIASEIRNYWKGKSVLVVGHSNTVPLIMTALGVEGVRPMNESDFGQLFIVKWLDGDDVTVEEARFGD